MSDPAQGRWFAIVAVRVAAAVGIVFGLVLLVRAFDWPTRALGIAILLAGFWCLAVVPRAMAHRWRSGGDQ